MADAARVERDELLTSLLRRTALNDQAAFERLYEATSPRLFAVALRMLRRRDWADDVMQEAYVRIWHNACEYQAERGAVLTWMISIVRYRAIDRLRRTRHDVHLETAGEDCGEADGDDVDPLQFVQAADDSRLLQGCMEELVEDQRRSIAMAFYEGLTHEQVSRRYQVPLGTVKSWIRRGLILLRRCLER